MSLQYFVAFGILQEYFDAAIEFFIVLGVVIRVGTISFLHFGHKIICPSNSEAQLSCVSQCGQGKLKFVGFIFLFLCAEFNA